MTSLADQSGPVRLRARAIDPLIDALRDAGAVRQRVAELVAHVVAAHAAALERLVALAEDPSVLERHAELSEVRWVNGPADGDRDADGVDRYGNRIESLLTAIDQSASPELAEAARRLAGEVGELYGEQLGRAFELLHDSGQGATIRAALADDLISSLLVVHDLHPRSLGERVTSCLEELAETLPEHGGVAELVGIDDEGRVLVEIRGGSELHRWRTRLEVERAIERAAPDHGGIVVGGAEAEPPTPAITTVIPVDSIRRTAPRRVPSRWVDLPELSALDDGAVTRITVDGGHDGADRVTLVACNVAGDLYLAVDPFDDDESVDGCRLVGVDPPTIEGPSGARFAVTAPLPVQRTDSTIEVKVP